MTSSTETADELDLAPSARRVPDFFIVGHHKSGTTAMYAMLRRHPQIFMPDMKEPEFFGRNRLDRGAPAEGSGREPLWAGPGTAAPKTGGRPRPKTYAQTRPQTYTEYLSLFAAAAADQRVGEASPSYLYSATAAGEIARARPGARIIAILREPASFLYSLHLQMLRDHVQRERDLGKAIAAEGVARAGERAPRYTDRVRYVEQLRRYHGAFGREQVLVLIYDDFRADNETTVRGVLRFLDVDPDIAIEPVDVNPARAARSQWLDDWSLALRAGRGPVSSRMKATLRALTPLGLRRRMIRAVQRNVVYGGASPPDERLMLELRRRFKPEVIALGEYMKRDLVHLWGYDDIG